MRVKNAILALLVGGVVAVAAPEPARGGTGPNSDTSAIPAAGASLNDGEAAFERGDYAAAIRIFRPFAERGDAVAQFLMGSAYHALTDYGQAVKWYRRAAEQGVLGAQDELGRMYVNGLGVTQDYAEAIKWLRSAAEGEVALETAQFSLGQMYDAGRGVPQNDREAAKWYRLAAEQGHAPAMNNLGVMSEFGQGMLQDYAQAHKWYNMAAACFLSSDADERDRAVKNRDRVAGKMTPAQVGEAQRLARDWKPKQKCWGRL